MPCKVSAVRFLGRDVMSAEVRRETIELPTYVLRSESPNPCFTKQLGAHPYPYRMQNRLSSERIVRQYDCVILENEFLRLTFLPDFGCRLFSAYDKLLGREIFYRNDCIKPALIAIRGAWISGGIEYNFPIGHSVYTYSRIPYVTRQNADGSVSIIFGHTERMTGMRFTMEVRLAPEEYRFFQHGRLYNGTSMPHRHYWWTNAGVYQTPRTQLIYPMTMATSGAYGDEMAWPVHKGTDLSWAYAHETSCDIFATEVYDDFFGIYYWDWDYGVAHWSPREELPGRKAFFWGRDEMGRLWQRMLTENAGDYFEIQAGRFATQGDFDFLMPHELVEFNEVWIPVGPTGGFVKAHKEGVINIREEGAATEVIIQMTRKVPQAQVLVLQGGITIKERRLDLLPGCVERISIEHPAKELNIEIRDSGGRPILQYDSLAKDRIRNAVPRTSVMPPKVQTPDEVLQAACVFERLDSLATAEEHYWRLLGTEHEAEGRKGLARLRLLAGRLQEAAEQARIALCFRHDPEATAYLALALGDSPEAGKLWRSLLKDTVFGKLASWRLALAGLRDGAYKEVIQLYENNPCDPLLTLAAAVSARKLGETEQGLSLICKLQDTDPLWRTAQWERYFLESGLFNSSDLVQSSGKKRQVYPTLLLEGFQEDMDAAAWYFELGLLEEAREVINAWVEYGPPDDPFLNGIAVELGIELPSKRRPDELGIVNCFAHRGILMRILERQPDAEARTHIGCMLYVHGRIDEAIEHWKQACEAGSANHMPYRNLALAYWCKKNDPETAYKFMLKANQVSPGDAETLRDLDILAETTGRDAERVKVAENILKYAPDDSGCLERAVRAFLEVGRLDEAVELITTKRFFVPELAYHTRILYVRALLMRGARLFSERNFKEAARDFQKATEYPENIGASKFHDSSDAQAYYLLGLALEQLGLTKEAVLAWKSAADDIAVRGAEQAFYVGRAREKLGRKDASDAFDLLLPTSALRDADNPHAHARDAYLQGLHLLAMGEAESAAVCFKTAREIELSAPAKMHAYLEAVCQTRSEGRRMPIPVWWTVEPTAV